MTQDCPGDVAVLELRNANLAGEGAVWLVENILCSDFYAFAQVLTREQKVHRWWRDDNFWKW